jgi:hypothetical protein
MNSKSNFNQSVNITLESNNKFESLKISKDKLLKIRGGDDPPKDENPPVKPPIL